MQRPESKVDACRLAAPIAIYSSQHEFSSKAPCCSSTQNWYQQSEQEHLRNCPWHRSCPPRKKTSGKSACVLKSPCWQPRFSCMGKIMFQTPQPWTAIFSQSLQGFNLRHLTFLTLAKNRVAPNPASLLFFHCTFGASHFWKPDIGQLWVDNHAPRHLSENDYNCADTPSSPLSGDFDRLFYGDRLVAKDTAKITGTQMSRVQNTKCRPFILAPFCWGSYSYGHLLVITGYKWDYTFLIINGVISTL